MRRAERGFALLAALGIMAVLMVLTASYALAVRTETRLADTALRAKQASWLAEAGLQRAFVELRQNPSRFTALSDEAEDGEPLVLSLLSDDEPSLELAAGRFTVRGWDEAARVNLNTASQELLEALLAAEPQLAEAILDWRDTDDAQREGGAENEYYTSLQDPYVSRDNWFETIAELLMVRDVTAARFFGAEGLSPLASADTAGQVAADLTPLASLFTVDSFDQNVGLDGTEPVDLATADRETLTEQFEGVLDPQDINAILEFRDGGQQPVEEQPGAATDELALSGIELPSELQQFLAEEGTNGETPTNGAAEQEASRLQHVAQLVHVLGRDKLRQVWDDLTVGTDQWRLGLINLNTASAEILASLPGMDSYLADLIVGARRDEPFETVADLLRLTEISDDVFAQVAPFLTTRSLAYRLRAEGTVGEGDQALTRRIEAVVQIELQPRPRSAPGATGEATAATGETEEEVPERTLRLVYRRME